MAAGATIMMIRVCCQDQELADAGYTLCAAGACKHCLQLAGQPKCPYSWRLTLVSNDARAMLLQHANWLRCVRRWSGSRPPIGCLHGRTLVMFNIKLICYTDYAMHMCICTAASTTLRYDAVITAWTKPSWSLMQVHWCQHQEAADCHRHRVT